MIRTQSTPDFPVAGGTLWFAKHDVFVLYSKDVATERGHEMKQTLYYQTSLRVGGVPA
jgi:hypothetical protein